MNSFRDNIFKLGENSSVLHTVKCFKYSYQILMVLFNINHLFTHS